MYSLGLVVCLEGQGVMPIAELLGAKVRVLSMPGLIDRCEDVVMRHKTYPYILM